MKNSQSDVLPEVYMENKSLVRSRTTEMEIGRCTYIVTTHYNSEGRETAEDKLFKIVSDRIAEELKSP